MDDLVIVIPAYDAALYLPLTMSAATAAARGRKIVVVDAGSNDRTAARGKELGARVVRLPKRAGPAEARNAGVDGVQAEIVLFIDADCVPHLDVVERVLAAFKAEPNLVAISGSYDDDPPERNFASSYMNLRHSFTHHRARRESSVFWAGCGAVRREAFLHAGGFDARRYPRPMIEDLELGLRLAPLGKLRIDPRIQVKHLKRWSLASVVRTDIASRALPWFELILESGKMPDDLNFRRSQRIAAALAPLTLASMAVLPFAVAMPNSYLVAACAAVIATSLALQLDLVMFFRRRRGFTFAVLAFVFHQIHLVYSSVTFALCAMRRRGKPA